MTTPNLQLPEVPQAIQNQAAALNAGFLELDAVVQLAVLDKDVTFPPAAALQGDRYIVPEGAESTWVGRQRSIAFRGPASWLFFVPRPGWRARVLDEAADYLYDGVNWVIEETGGGGGGGGLTPLVPDPSGTYTLATVTIDEFGRTVDAESGAIVPAGKFLRPISNGDPDNPEVIFFDGDFLFVEQDVIP